MIHDRSGVAIPAGRVLRIAHTPGSQKVQVVVDDANNPGHERVIVIDTTRLWAELDRHGRLTLQEY